MQFIDEQGRLFGVVNVVDVLVVLGVLAVVVAGVVLVTGEEEPTVTGYATITFEPQSELAGVELTEDDILARPGEDESLNVTDVHVTAGPNRRTRYVAKVAVTDEVDGPRIGTHHRFVTDSTLINGTVQRISQNQTLAVGETALHVVATAPAGALPRFEPGDRLRVENRTIGEIVSVRSYPTPDTDVRTLRVGVRVRTIRIGPHPTFGGEVLRPGATIPLWTDDASADATVERVGDTAPPGTPVNATVTLAWEGVSSERADQITTGATESHRGADARVVGYEVDPASVVVPTDTGTLVTSEHPRKRDVTITLAATAYQRNGDLTFHGDPLRIGRTVHLAFDRVTVEATVTGIETEG